MVLVDWKYIGSDVCNIRCGAIGVLLVQDGHRTVKRIMVIFKSTGRTRMKYLLAVLVSFVILDGVVTEWLVSEGQAREANPFLEPLVGDIGFMLLKAAGALFCTLILWDVYRRFPRIAIGATWCFVVAYGFIVAWNSSLFLI